MQFWQRALAALAWLSLASCGGSAAGTSEPTVECAAKLPPTTDCASAGPSYSAQVSQVIASYCLECHAAGNQLSSVVLGDYDSVYKNRSNALTQLYRCNMPPIDGTPLPDDTRELLLEYFSCGAPNN